MSVEQSRSHALSPGSEPALYLKTARGVSTFLALGVSNQNRHP
jgi:hypothetical protein